MTWACWVGWIFLFIIFVVNNAGYVVSLSYKLNFLSMRLVFRLFLTFLMLHLVACSEPEKQEQINLFDVIPPQSSYMIKVNHAKILSLSNPVVVDAYLSATDKAFLSRAGFQLPFAIHIMQNNSKIKGFVAIGKLKQIDSVFNGKTTTYETFKIRQETYKKQNYYATEINNLTFISNQKLLIENCIRDKEDLSKLSQSESFQKGVKSLDTNADLNIISFLQRLKPDVFYRSAFKVSVEDFGTWQFFDLVETGKAIATGITLSQDKADFLSQAFKNVSPVSNNLMSITPFAVDQCMAISFDDFEIFTENFLQIKAYAPKEVLQNKAVLSTLKAVNFFMENNNKALLLQLDDNSQLVNDEDELVTEFNHYEIHKFKHNSLINNCFSGIFPNINARFYTLIDSAVLVTESQSYLEKVLNDIQNHATLGDSKIYQALKAEIPEAYHLVLFKNKLKIAGKKYMAAQTYQVDQGTVFTNFVLKSFSAGQDQKLIEQVLSYPLKDLPKTVPQLVYNHKTKTYNIIYQDEDNTLRLLNLNGKLLWKMPLKDKITGKIKQVDLLRNRKLQYTFVTPHHWYVVDRLGRNVEKFPEHFMQKITQGISVFDYDKNRKYRFGITQSDKFRLYDNNAKKVKGFKVKTQSDIISPPQHFRIGSKDFIQMQDDEGRLYLLNRRGDTRIKVSQTFKTTRNPWGVYNQKFVNIDDDDQLIAIDLSGKVKSAKMDFGKNILSQIKNGHLAAIADNKLLIDKQLVDLDLGQYTRPDIFKAGKDTFIFVANQTDDRIYAFDTKGHLLPNFPVIGKKVLDFKSNKNGRYLLVYDSTHNITVYKF